ncbi:TlpA family protein disulfide reductase [Microbacterium murale]|uniref:Thioredoxin-like negative regulator of GroEL n=1 Tax=Microbacterium murale TaxID=1081040 RepID=A0ABU0PD53_9MICO|nr:thioredoxin family protein [Microbacterium murale]MDQ0645248.1 thioredoxin-like negative regulator of GroEL [Microbacterium murale]
MSVSIAFVITGAIVALAIVCGIFVRAQDGRRRSGGHLQVRSEDLAGSTFDETATLVQFSTELCARCPQVRRLLGQIADAHSGVSHVEIDLTNRNDLATRYHVLQTPTTFLVDASGAVLSRWGGVPHRSAIEDALASVLTLHRQEQK